MKTPTVAGLMLQSHPRHRSEVISRQVDEEFVVYDPVEDQSALLNQSAAVVFALCRGELTVQEIIRGTADHYNAEEEAVQSAVLETITLLSKQGFLE